ncbi:MAG: PAS domain-containing protein [Enhydrobacter sp.]|nr:MAG: PAS domain-containing protein [Enhydrobacter sp.]
MTLPDGQDELTAILEGIGEGFYALDRDWRITRFNSEAARHFGRPAGEMIGRRLWDLFPDALNTDLGRLFIDTMTRRATVRGETPSVIVGQRRLAYRLFPLGDGMGIVFRDVTDLRKAEEQRELLINELNHRVKNTLAIVQSIASQTLRDVAPSIRADFEQRLVTLSSVHGLLTSQHWDSVELREVVKASLRPHLGAHPRVAFDGPSQRLAQRSAVALSMALHELGTNALKYGALSVESGKVTLDWSIESGTFLLTWRESGGPPVRARKRGGFGSQLIERALSAQLQGEARLDFRPDGLVCTIRCPLAILSEEAQS